MTIRTFGEMRDDVAARVGASRAADILRVEEYCEQGLDAVWRRSDDPGRERETVLTGETAAEYTMNFTKGSTAAVRVAGTAFDSDDEGKLLIVFGSPPYRIDEVTDGDNVVLERAWFEATNATQECHLYRDELDLPDDCAEVLDQRIQLLVEDGKRLDWIPKTTGSKVRPWPTSEGEPAWVTPGRRTRDGDRLFTIRSLRFGPSAFDDDYQILVPYLNRYPELPESATERTNELIHLPRERRSLAIWYALSVAYSEQPFLDTEQAERFEARFERELDRILRSQDEETAEVIYVEDF